jgi:hypothetical protein
MMKQQKKGSADMPTDGQRELSQAQSVVKMFLEFADDSLGAIAQICKSFKVDPARRDLAKLINMGETASLRVPSERAGVIKKALEDADVTFERFNLSINGGGTATEFIFPKVYEEKVLELMRNGTIKDAVELYENRPGGQVSRKDILEQSQGNYGSVGPLDEAEAMLMEDYAKRMNVPIAMDASEDGRATVFFSAGDRGQIDRISREIIKDLDGKSGEILRKQLLWESHNDAQMINRAINDYKDPENGQKLEKGSAFVSENGYRIDVRRSDFFITRPDGTTEAISKNPEKITRIVHEGESGPIIRSGRLLEAEMAGMKGIVYLDASTADRFTTMNEKERQNLIREEQYKAGRSPITEMDKEELRRSAERRDLIEAKLAIERPPEVAVKVSPYCVDQSVSEYMKDNEANIRECRDLDSRERDLIQKIRNGTAKDSEIDKAVSDDRIKNIDRFDPDFASRPLGEVGVFEKEERDYEPDHAFEEEGLDMSFYDEQYGRVDEDIDALEESLDSER